MGQSCEKAYSPLETATTALFQVLPMHANPLGMLFGGIMEDWMVQAATMEAVRVARRPALLASLDSLYFISPVLVGENVSITSWVDYIGRSSLEISLLVMAENPIMNEFRLTTLAHMVYVAVGKDLRPVPLDVCISPKSHEEEMLYEDAIKRRSARQERIANRKDKVLDVTPPKGLSEKYMVVNEKVVMPEDIMHLNTLFAGRLMRWLDELTALVAERYSRGPVVTASVDSTDFYSPVLLGETVRIYSTLTYVGKSSLEVMAKVITRDEISGIERHTTTSYFTLVHIGPTGRSEPVPPFEPTNDEQKKIIEEAEARRKLRLAELETFKKNADAVLKLIGPRLRLPT